MSANLQTRLILLPRVRNMSIRLHTTMCIHVHCIYDRKVHASYMIIIFFLKKHTTHF
jgi:hypothetical protein